MRMMRRLLCLGAGLAMSAAAGLAGAADKPEITIGYVDGWSDSVATTHVAAEVIRQKLGYDVKLMPVAAGIMWQGVARGKLDAILSAWLPTTHGAYYEKMKDKVVNLGINYPDAKIGLIVPEYVKANSIEDLQAQKADFGGRIVGIDAGSGVMLKTDQAIKDYGLDYKLVASSGSGMISELTRAESEKKAIAVTGWIPHWMFAKWKLKFLEDPKKVYGDVEHVDSIANPALEAKAKPVWDFLKQFRWKNGQEVGEVMLAIQEGEKPDVAAKKWVDSNPDRVKEWLN
ncbi:Glycine betaine/carnitine transport binding protein GbuC precursor [compost metagenome]